MKKCLLLKVVAMIAASVAFGILIQIILPDVFIIAICCALILIMGIVVAKFT